jgi:hypothetical protein
LKEHFPPRGRVFGESMRRKAAPGWTLVGMG